jgi:hypothetical protein
MARQQVGRRPLKARPLVCRPDVIMRDRRGRRRTDMLCRELEAQEALGQGRPLAGQAPEGRGCAPAAWRGSRPQSPRAITPGFEPDQRVGTRERLVGQAATPLIVEHSSARFMDEVSPMVAPSRAAL